MTEYQQAPRADTANTAKKVYRRPEIIEWGSVVDMTKSFLNGLVDPTFGGSVPGFQGPPPRNGPGDR